MGHAHADQKIENPGVLKSAGAWTGIFGVLIVIGLISFFALFSGGDHAHAWTAVLRSHFYFMGISICAVFFLAIHWITTSMWSSAVRRLAEGFTNYLPFVLVSTILVFLGAKSLYKWTDLAYVHADPVVLGKAGYLNMGFFMTRTLIAIAGWYFFAKKLVGYSLKSDTATEFKPLYETARKVAVAFIVFFAITFSMSAFDQLMSIDAHFFSTMFGVYIFAGSFQSFWAVLAIVTIIMKRNGYLGKIVNTNHVHDIAKMMFAFTVFWAYTAFSQYMLIWYANLPEETAFFILRFSPAWTGWSLGLFIGNFCLPFLILLPRGNKRSDEVVFLSACWILVMHYFDYNWLIQPQFYQDGPVFSPFDVGVWLGFLGVFGLCVTAFYKKNNLVAIKDPYLPESVFHHHI